MLLVRPLSISCLCRKTAMRAEPRPLSRMGRPRAPLVRMATSVLFPLSTAPATVRKKRLGYLLLRMVKVLLNTCHAHGSSHYAIQDGTVVCSASSSTELRQHRLPLSGRPQAVLSTCTLF